MDFLNQDPLLILAEILVLFYLLGIYAAIHVLNHGRTSQGTIAWFVALLTMPYIAAPLYLIFGYHKFWGYVKARRAGDTQLSGIVDAILKNPNLDDLVVENQSPLMQVSSDLARMPFSRGNRAKLLIDGEATFSAIFEAIEKAEQYVLVQFYILRDDLFVWHKIGTDNPQTFSGGINGIRKKQRAGFTTVGRPTG